MPENMCHLLDNRCEETMETTVKSHSLLDTHTLI